MATLNDLEKLKRKIYLYAKISLVSIPLLSFLTIIGGFTKEYIPDNFQENISIFVIIIFSIIFFVLILAICCIIYDLLFNFDKIIKYLIKTFKGDNL